MAVCTSVKVFVWVMTMTPEMAGDAITDEVGMEEVEGMGRLMLPEPVRLAVGPEMNVELLMGQMPDEAPDGSEAEAEGTPCEPDWGVGRTVVMVTVWDSWPGPPGMV